jgi:hypothetical protein
MSQNVAGQLAEPSFDLLGTIKDLWWWVGVAFAVLRARTRNKAPSSS